jgi:hypothetical protein
MSVSMQKKSNFASCPGIAEQQLAEYPAQIFFFNFSLLARL